MTASSMNFARMRLAARRVARLSGHAPGERAVAAALVVAALALRLGLAWVTPPFQAPDEEAHFRYVAFLLERGALPVQPPRNIERDLDFWPQYYQPPLAYLLFAPLDAALRAAGVDEPGRVRGLRAQNALLGALTVWLAFQLACRLAPRGDPRRVAIPLVVALLPGFAATGASVNNDTLANALMVALWLPLVSVAQGVGERGDRSRAAWATGLAFGAACLAKLTVLSQAPLLFLVPWLARRDDPAGALRFAVRAGAGAALVFGPWAIRNVLVYGDPLAIGVGSISFAWLSDQLPAEKLAELARPRPAHAFGIFVGKLGIFHNLRFAPLAWAWGALALLAAAGWLRRPGREAPPARNGAFPVALRVSFLAAPLLAGVGLTWFSLRYYGGWQGRYLFTALLPVAALLAEGWQRLTDGRRAWAGLLAIALLLLALDVALVAAVQRFFDETPPLRWGFKTPL